MNIKEYLSQGRYLEQRINSKLEQRMHLRQLAQKITSTISDVAVSEYGTEHRMEKRVLRLVELEREIDEDIDQLVDLRREITEAIQSVQLPEHHVLLELRYLNNNTWEEIAERMHYSWRNIYNIHTKALKEVKLDTSCTEQEC